MSPRRLVLLLIATGLLGAGGAIAWSSWRKPEPVAAAIEPATPSSSPRPSVALRPPISRAEDAPTSEASSAAAVAALNVPDALASALGESDAERRAELIEKALQAWAAVDVDAAGAWAMTQTVLLRPNAIAAVVKGAAAANPDEAERYVMAISATDPENALEYGSFLIVALAEAGEHARAAAWAGGGNEPNIDWLTSAYDRWGGKQPEAALLNAVALPDPIRRRAASDAAIGAWARIEPRALAECAVNFPPGQEKNLAIITALRAWATTEPDKVSEWMIAHRDAIAAVPNLAVINED